jgi:ribosomal-protein-alanine N-acetyltransferase
MSPRIALDTPRLILRELDIDDAPSMVALNDDPEVVRYTGDGPFASLEAARAFVEAYRRDVYPRDGFGRWAVVPKAGQPRAGDNVGFCGLRRDGDDVDLGYRLTRDTWGLGYATEAGRACLAWGFAHANLERIIARAHVDNARSIRVLEKLGMTFVSSIDMEGMPGVLYEMHRS